MLISILRYRIRLNSKIPWNILIIADLIILISSCGAGNSGYVAESSPQPMQEISFLTEDGVKISGSWIVPTSSEVSSAKFPVIILLHDYGLDRRDWGIAIPDFVEQGFSVLAFDSRGHGQSTVHGMRVSGKYSFDTSAAFLDSGLLDIQGAVEWLKDQENVNLRVLSLIGVGAGGDLAYLGARQFASQIRSTVVISPSLAALTEGSFTTGSMPRGILFCASSGDASGSSMMAAESLVNFTDSPKKVVIYASNAHGLAMFYRHPEMIREILAWLRK